MALTAFFLLLHCRFLVPLTSPSPASAQEGSEYRPEPLPRDAVLCFGSRNWKHAGEVDSVAFSRDGQLALSGSSDRTRALWDRKTGHRLRTFGGHPSGVSAVGFTSDSKRAGSA